MRASFLELGTVWYHSLNKDGGREIRNIYYQLLWQLVSFSSSVLFLYFSSSISTERAARCVYIVTFICSAYFDTMGVHISLFTKGKKIARNILHWASVKRSTNMFWGKLLALKELTSLIYFSFLVCLNYEKEMSEFLFFSACSWGWKVRCLYYSTGSGWEDGTLWY